MAGVATAGLLTWFAPLDWPGLDDRAARVVGWAFGIGGIGLAVWAIATLIRAKTTVRPDRAAQHLVTWGPFTRFRNPIYLADVMILLGMAEWTKSIWFVIAAGVFGVLVTWLAILPEERHLTAVFGDTYREYKARSRRWL